MELRGEGKEGKIGFSLHQKEPIFFARLKVYKIDGGKTLVIATASWKFLPPLRETYVDSIIILQSVFSSFVPLYPSLFLQWLTGLVELFHGIQAIPIEVPCQVSSGDFLVAFSFNYAHELFFDNH